MLTCIGIYEIRQSKGLNQNSSLKKISEDNNFNSKGHNQKDPIPDIGGDDFSKSYSKGSFKCFIPIGMKNKILTR